MLLDQYGRSIGTPPKKDWPYIIVFREGADNRPPLYFSTHGSNLAKFENREAEGFHIVGHVTRKGDKSASEIAALRCAEANAKIQPR